MKINICIHDKKYLLTWEKLVYSTRKNICSHEKITSGISSPQQISQPYLRNLFFFSFLPNQVKNDYSQESPGTEQLSPISGHSGGHSSSSSGLASLSVSVNIDLVYLVINWFCSVFVFKLFVQYVGIERKPWLVLVLTDPCNTTRRHDALVSSWTALLHIMMNTMTMTMTMTMRMTMTMTMTKTKKMLTIQTQCKSLTARMVADLISATHEVALRVAADLIRCSVHIFPINAVLSHRETSYSTKK